MKALINGTEYKVLTEFTISEQTSNKTSSDISVLVENQPFPVSGDIIELYDGETCVFWGTCGIPTGPAYSTGLEPKLYSITCGNANSILSNRIINMALQQATITEIVNTIFEDYISLEGVTLGAISNIDVSLEVYTAADMNLQEALNELADLVGAIWQIDANRKFSFLVYEDFPAFPKEINPSFLLGSELQHTTKSYTLRTVQYISGATDVTQEQTESYIYDGENNVFTTVFPVAAAPSIYINNQQIPAYRISPAGLETEETAFTYSYNSRSIEYIWEGAGELVANDVVKIVYTGIFPIRVAVSNYDKINQISQLTGTSGLIEKVELANNITNFSDAYQLAQSLLSQFSEARGEITWWLTTEQLAQLGMTIDDVALLTKITFYLPDLGIQGDYVITEREITPFYGDLSTNFAEKLKVSLKLTDRDYIKSYGQVISDLRKDINQLSIRADDTVISTGNISDTFALSETLITDFNTVYYPTGTTPVGIFSPLQLGAVYPV